MSRSSCSKSNATKRTDSGSSPEHPSDRLGLAGDADRQVDSSNGHIRTVAIGTQPIRLRRMTTASMLAERCRVLPDSVTRQARSAHNPRPVHLRRTSKRRNTADRAAITAIATRARTSPRVSRPPGGGQVVRLLQAANTGLKASAQRGFRAIRLPLVKPGVDRQGDAGDICLLGRQPCHRVGDAPCPASTGSALPRRCAAFMSAVVSHCWKDSLPIIGVMTRKGILS